MCVAQPNLLRIFVTWRTRVNPHRRFVGSLLERSFAVVLVLHGLVTLLIALSFGSVAFATPWIASVDQRQGLPILSKGGAKAMSSDFVFWGSNWAWARQETILKVLGPFEYVAVGKNHVLDFDLSSRINKLSNRELAWEFDLNARNTVSDAIGGGIVFKFDLAAFGSELGDPELLPGKRGWSWGKAGRSRVEMRFDPPLATVYFEQGKRSEVRAFFYKDRVPQGLRRHFATLSISDDMTIGPTVEERFGLDDRAVWPTDILDWRVSPVDLSFLNSPEKPAGKHGFLRVVKDQLVFEDGKSVRFWGTNVVANALFETTHENVRQQARRLSELGFNLVRLHHHDSAWVDPNIFGDLKSPDTLNLSPAMFAKLDWWIKCLKDEGIYIWLDLHVGRRFKAGDGIIGFEEIRKDKPTADLRGYNFVNPSIQQSMKRFNEAYITHTNGYTGLRYKDEPAIIAMLISNENDVTNHFGNRLLPDRNVPIHSGLYQAQAEAFAARHGLQKTAVWRSWEYGPSKLFLNDLEYRFYSDMIQYLLTLGAKVPIVTTSTWGDNPLISLPALTVGSLIDAHSYGGVGDLERNPAYAPNLMHWLAAAQVAGRPLSVSEWNVFPFPIPDRHVTPLYLAASARLQGWKALMQYAYAKEPINHQGKPSNWQAYNDPGLIATLPAAALLYRQGHVEEASTIYAFAPGKEQLLTQSISPGNAIALRSAAEKGKLVIVLPESKEMPWLKKSEIPSGAKVIADTDYSLVPIDGAEAVSDTGELRRNWEQGVYTINTPRTQAAMGWIGRKKISLSDVEIMVNTLSATVAVQSMNEHPINRSRAILISLGARSVPKSENGLPFYSEPVEGQIIIRAPKGLKLYKENRSEKETQEIIASHKGGRYRISLDRSLATYWLVLK